MPSLSELLEGVSAETIGGNPEITAITIDSREAAAGSLFVCIRGNTADGHDFIAQAVSGGAVAVVVDDEYYVSNSTLNVTYMRVDDTKKALALIAANFYGNPADKLKLFGITGTNGKTSSTYFMAAVLARAGIKCGIIGTTGNFAGEEELAVKIKTSTTPDTIELHAIFAEMLKRGVTHVVMEATSHALFLDKLHGLHFEAGIFTNLTQDHLDFHGTMEDYYAAKCRLFPLCRVGVFNADDEYGARLGLEGLCRSVSYGVEAAADYRAEGLRSSVSGTAFTLRGHEFSLKIPGRFMLYNALGVAAAALEAGLPIDAVQGGIDALAGVPGRIFPIENSLGIGVYVDYAHTPDALLKVIRAVREFTRGKIVTVFGCGGERDRTKRPIMGKIAGELSDYCVITSDNPRGEDPGSIIAAVREGVLQTDCEYVSIADRREAIRHAIGAARSGDSVIIAGKGHENYQEFEGKRREHFDDVEEAGKAVEAAGVGGGE